MVFDFRPFEASLRLGDVVAMSHAAGETILMRQRARLQALIEFVRKASPFYGSLYEALPEAVDDLRALPVIGKTRMMERFDDVVTDRRITRELVDAHSSNKSRIGHLLNGNYALWKSSGTTGNPGVFLHDRDALATYDLLYFVRSWSALLAESGMFPLWHAGGRMACVTAVEDHYAGISSWRRMALTYPHLGPLMRDFSVLAPLEHLVDGLNRWQPAHLVGYPSVLALLAHEQIEGRLRIAPSTMIAGGECLDVDEHDLIEDAFRTRLRSVYACAECDYIAFECAERWLHVNADWIVLEPVDRDFEPVSPGEPSDTCLITNLANRIQPVIRYEIPDSVTLRPDACPCGSPLPAIRVEGRRNQALRFRTLSGRMVTILPMAITTVLELIPGLRRFQIDRSGAATLLVRCEFEQGGDKASIGQHVLRHLTNFLHDKGLHGIDIQVTEGGFAVDRGSGKFRQVVSSFETGTPG